MGEFKKGGLPLSGHRRGHHLGPQLRPAPGQRAKDMRVKLLLLGKKRS